MQKGRNVVVIMSDEHNPKVMGCAGHPLIQTPHLDALAGRGTRFKSAYTTSPVCVPARAAFAAGKYVHQIGFWDNADAYDGSINSWHHQLRDSGHTVTSIGKLHFSKYDEDHGFTEEIVPMHIFQGKGDLMGLIREDLPRRGGAKKMAGMAGPGESTYTQYDRDICARAQVWLRTVGKEQHDKPWVLFISLVAPHFPLTAPPEHYYRYFNADVPMPKLYQRDQRPDHPYLNDYRSSFAYDDYFESDEDVRRALAGYFGLVSFLDEQIGKIVTTLDETSLADSTDIIYTSDHGDNLGARGLWGKSTMFEEIAGVPLICVGQGFPAGKTVSTPVSHVDAFPTIVAGVGADPASDGDDRPGVDLRGIANAPDQDRLVLSEYHAMGSSTGAFMIRHGKYKYVHYVKYPAQLYDLEADPEEIQDVANDPRYQAVREQCHAKLLQLLDPVDVDRRAKLRQAELLAKHGGRDAVIQRGDVAYSPPPGLDSEFS